MAENISLFAETQEICRAHRAVDEDLIEALSQAGWAAPSKGNSEGAVRMLADGLLLVARGEGEGIDWPNRPDEMLRLATRLATAAREQTNVVFVTKSREASLVVYDIAEANATRIRCLYAGSGDEDFRETMNILDALNQQSGRDRKDPKVQMFNMETTDAKRKIYLKAGRFDTGTNDALGRAPFAEFAFSLVSIWSQSDSP